MRDGICVDPSLCRDIYGLRITGLVCEGETVGKKRIKWLRERERTCARGQCQVR